MTSQSPLRVLLLEDNVDDAGLIRELLEGDNFVCEITLVQTRPEYEAALETDEIDVILADYKLPSFDGLSALKLAQTARPEVPFIFVSGSLGEDVAIEALKIGATDYVLKTRLARLVPAVRRALREAEERAERKKAVEALRRRERELRDVIETVPTAAWTALPDGFVDFINRQWLEFAGLSAKGALGSGWQVAVHPGDLQRHVDKWHASLATGDPFENEVRYRRAADGQYRWFLARAVPLRDEQGKILKWYGISTDIEDRKRAESLLTAEKSILETVAKGDSLAEILNRLCRLVEEHAAGVLASILLLEGNRLRHGAAPSLPKAYSDAIDGTVIGPSAGSCGTAAYQGEQVIVGDIATDPLWANYCDLALPHGLRACWSTPIFSSQRKVIGTFAMYYNEPRRPSLADQQVIEQITGLAGVAIERKLIQVELRRSETYLAEAHRLSHTGSWAFNATGAAYWSEENSRIWGFDPQQGPPDREMLLQRVHPEDRDRVVASVQKAIKEGRDYAVEFRIVLPEGTVRHVHGLGHPVFEGNGQLVEVVGTVMDVTERKRAEEERERLRQLQAELAHINRVSMMGELTASVAHELNQPISAAITSANACLQWLTRDPPDLERAQAAARRVEKDGTRAAEIIQGLRAFYKKGAPPQRELVDVNEVAREMLPLLRDEANRHSISMRTELAGELPKTRADRVQLQQVFMNLMLNGIEAMKDTGGELTVRSERTEDGEVLMSVRDTGVGLPTEKVEEIFSAFFTTKSQGTGMGLSICRTIVESHGGRLWASANTGRGAIFHFTLPREAVASSASAA